MGLLTAPLTLVRAPLRLTLRAWELGLSAAAEAARIGTELLDPSRGAPPPDFGEQRTPEPPGFGDNGQRTAPAEPPPLPSPPRPTPRLRCPRS